MLFHIAPRKIAILFLFTALSVLGWGMAASAAETAPDTGTHATAVSAPEIPASAAALDKSDSKLRRLWGSTGLKSFIDTILR